MFGCFFVWFGFSKGNYSCYYLVKSIIAFSSPVIFACKIPGEVMGLMLAVVRVFS